MPCATGVAKATPAAAIAGCGPACVTPASAPCTSISCLPPQSPALHAGRPRCRFQASQRPPGPITMPPAPRAGRFAWRSSTGPWQPQQRLCNWRPKEGLRFPAAAGASARCGERRARSSRGTGWAGAVDWVRDSAPASPPWARCQLLRSTAQVAAASTAAAEACRLQGGGQAGASLPCVPLPPPPPRAAPPRRLRSHPCPRRGPARALRLA